MSEAAFAQALANVQAAMPAIGKDQKATVTSKSGGSYTYRYADLATILEKVMPVLAQSGFAWLAIPQVESDRSFVLRCSLMHKDGHRETGEYPLPHPSTGTPQSIGSAITYARRYMFCAMVGVAADEDDDGQAARTSSVERPKAAAKQPHPGDAIDTSDPWQPPVDTATGEIAPSRPYGVKPVSEAQLRMMGAVFGKAGITDRDERLAIVASVVDREISSAKDLSSVEASKVIDHLTKQEAAS